ncbi:MAG: hypothetical protein K8U57_07320 [Planctomycetes bacterium]|nr:hypothetical protein [Planctomycetota bacterium]
MRGTGLVAWGNETVYAYYTTDGNSVRVRLSVDEADRLGLSEGLRVLMTLPDRKPTDVLVMRVGRVPPFVWVEMTTMSSSATLVR